MPLIPKHDVNQIFASQAPSIDQPPEFKSYTGGWGVESRPNNGKPTIKGFNKLQQVTDEKLLWIHQNGAALPFDENMEYAENAPVIKDGVLVQKKGDEWKPVGANRASDILDESGLTQQEWNSGVAKQSDLLLLTNAKDGNRVFVKSIQQWFTYTPNTQETENGVTVINKGTGQWVMNTPDAYYASWFAVKDTQDSQSAQLRLAHEVATNNNRPLVIDGNYYVMPDLTNSWEDHKSVINVKDNSTIEFSPDGCITVLGNSFNGYYVLCCFRTKNFNIINPRVVGDLDTHTGTTGEWGYGIAIFEAKDGYIPNANLSKLWGDGFYVGKHYGSELIDVPTNITITDPVIDRVRRNGISFTSGDNVKIIRPVIKNVYGIAPEAGIDIEPEEASGKPMSKITNSVIDNPTFLNNTRNIWISWYNEDRHIDLNFTGITKIIGGDYPFTFYSSSAELSDKQTGVVNFQCIDFTCTTTNKIFETELSLEDRGAIINIEKLIIRNAERWQTHFVRFGTQDIAIAGLKVHSIQSETLNYATFTTNAVNGDKQTINPRLTLGFDPSVLVSTDPGVGYQIKYGAGKIGGYSLRDSTSSGSSYNYPSNNIIVKPFSDAYVSLNADYRKLKISIDAKDESINRTLYINDITVELINGTVKGGITLQGKGGFVEVQKHPTGRGVIYNAYGNVS